MRGGSVWARLLGVEKTIVDGVEFVEDDGVLVAHVRPAGVERSRCGLCRR
ncbi:MAG: ISL3 family transposase, partial [Sporichthyaceae bacterium]|nr:ISL3 family transposase [Sporichthyaceae bacterium]